MSEGKPAPPAYGYGYGYGGVASSNEASFHVNDLWRVIKNRWPTSVTILVLVMGTGFVVTKLQPKIYESSAVLRVEKEGKDLEVFQASFEGFDPHVGQGLFLYSLLMTLFILFTYYFKYLHNMVLQKVC